MKIFLRESFFNFFKFLKGFLHFNRFINITRIFPLTDFSAGVAGKVIGENKRYDKESEE